MTVPDHSAESALIAAGARHIAGVDEVGRGPLAGPVTAAAVILDPTNIPPGLNDSKRLSRKAREDLSAWLVAHCDHHIAHVGVDQIDEMNIYHASHLAMRLALAGLRNVPDHALIDGNRIPYGLTLPATAMVKGDARSVTIAAASIIAKVARDRIMEDLAQQHPGYDWDRNAGYPTRGHRDALLNLGVTPHHRRSFRPVHNILCKA